MRIAAVPPIHYLGRATCTLAGFAQGGCAGLTSAHSDHRLVQPTIWTCDDAADRSPSKSDGVVDLSVQHGHQLHAVLYHPLAPVFAGSRSHRLVFHQAAHSLSVEGGFA